MPDDPRFGLVDQILKKQVAMGVTVMPDWFNPNLIPNDLPVKTPTTQYSTNSYILEYYHTFTINSKI